MSTAGEIFAVIKKVMLVSEELTRQTAELKELSDVLSDHEGRLIRVETILSLSAKQNRIILPGS